MPTDPGSGLGSRRLPTTPEDIGDVGPSFESPENVNTFVIRPEYRLFLRLGKIEELFPHPPNTVRGRMERLQVLGLFYFPLGHARAETAFNGSPAVTPAAGDPPERTALGDEPAFPGAWSYFQNRVLNTGDNADEKIQERLAQWVVAGGELPEEAADPAAPAKANFKKIRLPGGYSTTSGTGARTINHDAAYPAPFGGDPHPYEDKFFEDNTVLGKIPLIAKVEKRNFETNEWEAARDAKVYFQLRPTYDPDHLATSGAETDNTSCVDRISRVPLRTTSVQNTTTTPHTIANNAGQKRFADVEEDPDSPNFGYTAPSEDDPQRPNCPHTRGGHSYGGKQGQGSLTNGTDVANIIFSTDSFPGFNAAYAVARSDDKARTRFFPTAEQESDASRPHCVKAATNEDGEAGVLLMPSRCAGDRYKLRVFLGPDTISGPGNDGEGAEAVRIDTGTLVVWRNARVARYVRQPLGTPAAILLTEAEPKSWMPAGATDAVKIREYLKRCLIVDGSNTNVGFPLCDFSNDGVTAGTDFDGVRRNWARGYVELVMDRVSEAALPNPEQMTETQWERARRCAMIDAYHGRDGMTLNYQVLFHAEAGSTINMSNAVVNVPMRSRAAYDAHASVTAAQRMGASGNSVAKVATMVTAHALEGFIRGITNNGFEPGLTLIQAGFGLTWQILGEGGVTRFSGRTTSFGGCFAWAGKAAFPTRYRVPSAGLGYGYSNNAAHELGHTWFRQHAPVGPGQQDAEHDSVTTPAANLSKCVMSYDGCEGQFCAKCLWAFRGWHITQFP